MNKNAIRLDTLRQLRELVESDIENLGPIMDDYDGGQKAAYDKCLKNISVYEAIINHSSDLA